MSHIGIFTQASDAITRAKAFATAEHEGVFRKGPLRKPYISHPLEVAQILRQHGLDNADSQITALLHDTVEDTTRGRETVRQEIAALFGAAILRLVDEVTDPPGLPKDERRRHQVESLAGKSATCQNVKIADKMSNLRSILESPPADWSPATKQDYARFSDDVVGACKAGDAGLVAAYWRLRAEFDTTLADDAAEV